MVQILDQTSAEVASTTVGGAGAFSVEIQPSATTTYVAVLAGATSDPVTVSVRAVLSVRMAPVRLFDRVLVRGVVRPAREGQQVVVTLLRSGHPVETRRATMSADGSFRATLSVNELGTYRAQATLEASDLLKGSARSKADAAPLPNLSSGSSGTFVRLLEKRLVDLHYRLAGGADGRYDFRTADAVVAFHKVQGMARTFTVDEATWRRLADPRVPHAVNDWPGSLSLHHQYYPSFFDGERALHGWTEVPTYAASHGCVRIPYRNAKLVYALADYGVRVVIHH